MKTRKGFLIQRGRTFYAVFTVAGKRIVKTTGQTVKTDAQKELARMMQPFLLEDDKRTLEVVKARIEGIHTELAEINDATNPPLPVGEAWTAFLAAQKRPDTGESTLAQYAFQWGIFWQWLRDNHPTATAMQDVTPDIAERFAAWLAAEGKSTNTVNKYLNVLALVFRVLKDKARLTVNPWESDQIIRKKIVTNSRREMTIEEIRRVCAAAEGELRTLLAIGIYTGLRLGDCSTLRWGEVDLARNIIRRIPNKTGRSNPKPVIVPLHPTLLAMLLEIPKKDRTGYVLPRIASDYLRHSTYVTDRVQALFERCQVETHKPGTGFETKTGEDGKAKEVHTGKRAVIEVGFHSLRHSFVSLCREAGAPLSVVESIVGHSNPAMTRHYTHTSEAAALAAVTALPSITGETVKALPPAQSPRLVDASMVSGRLQAMTAKTWKAIRDELLKEC